MRPRPTPMEPRIVQLTVKKNYNAPLEEYNKKVLLELTGGDSTSDRRGLDLVAVLDVSSSMQGEKMDKLKKAMAFVICKLSRIDRLSVVTFSNAAMKLCSLRQITEASQRELQELINLDLKACDQTNIMDGLRTGLKVLADRKVSEGRAVGIMLMSNGHQSTGDATLVAIGVVPVHTFSIGADSNPMVLSAVAANSMGGTFSHVQDIGGGGLTMAVSQCLAGLLTVMVQDLELTVAAIGDESRIVKVTAGSYPQEYANNEPGGSVTVRFGNIYSREVRRVIVDLLLPAVQSERRVNILKVTYSHSSSSSAGRLQYVTPRKRLTVWRGRGVDILEANEKPAELLTEEARLQTAKMMEEARTMADSKELYNARHKLLEAQHMLEDDVVAEPNMNALLRTELLELLKLLEATETYMTHGRAYALSSESSHDRQRFAVRGSSDIEIMRLFATPRMDRYLEQAKTFHDEPWMPVKSTEDDVKEELLARLMINVASSENEIRRLSLDTED